MIKTIRMKVSDGERLTREEGLYLLREAPLLDMAPDLQNDILIFFCVNLGCVASEEAAEAAEMLGYAQIFHYKEGTEDWYCPDHNGPVVGPGCGNIICAP
jgi:hypothetical protein